MPRGGAGYVVDVQSRMLEGLATRVVIPLIPTASAPRIPMKTLNPALSFEGGDFVLMTQNVASIPVAQLGLTLGTLPIQSDQIVRAIDALLSGI
jgi:toxin CcdB